MSSLEQIKYTTKIFDDFRIRGDKVLKNIHDKYENYKLQPKPIKKNFFNFNFWGLKFKLKLEIEFDSENKSFNKGEINTYLIKKGDNKLLLSVTYDNLGNAEQSLILDGDSFPEFYYLKFYDALISHINENGNEVKFQLKQNILS